MNAQYVDNWFYETADIVPKFLLEDIKIENEK